MKRQTVAFCTLGCKVNQSESQQMARKFEQMGYQVLDFGAVAQVYIINTCTVTKMADQKSRKMIRSLRKRNPRALIVVTGCYAQSGASELQAMGEVDLILDNQAKKDLTERVQQWLDLKISAELEPEPEPESELGSDPEPATQTGSVKGLNRTRGTLKIQDGCRQFCSYCIIPYVRGSWQSLTQAEVLNQARALAAAGYREIVLLGIHLGAFGWERQEKDGLSEVLERLLQQLPQVRFRLGSLEPMEASTKLLNLLHTYPNACQHLHLPLQCGQDDILRQMNRPYDTAGFLEKIIEIRQMMPQIALTTDVIVGFPGESEGKFQQGLDFVETVGFAGLHVFAYSQRPGTPADQMPHQVSPQDKELRSRRMIALGEILSASYAQQWAGRCQQVLVEETLEPGWWAGHTENYLEVTFPAASGLLKGSLQQVRLCGGPGHKAGSWAAELTDLNVPQL